MSQSLSWYMAHPKSKDNEKYCGHHSHPLKLIPTNAQTKIHANAPRNDSETEGTQLSDACTKTFWQHLARIKTNQLPQAQQIGKGACSLSTPKIISHIFSLNPTEKLRSIRRGPVLSLTDVLVLVAWVSQFQFFNHISRSTGCKTAPFYNKCSQKPPYRLGSHQWNSQVAMTLAALVTTQ